MTVSTMSPMSRKTGCGCGGTGTATVTASPCTCGSVECSTCLDPGYTRPKFFAGQLLTEDDLQLLGDYVVGKNRLHNRYLMGSGVVCGLDVTCAPCGGGHVVVNPGYALDCCGNDIVLTCSQDLDINKMAHELQIKMKGGHDCGDPCSETRASSNAGSNGSNIRNGHGSGNGTTKTTGSHTHKYCLYVNYCEQETEPVSPYATDEPCASSACEPTRIREGFRFELRCPEASEPGPEICSRFWNCVGDLPSYETRKSDYAVLAKYIPRLRTALAEVRANPTPPIPTDFSKSVTGHLDDLKAAVDKFSPEKTNAAAEFDRVIDAITALASDVSLYIIGTAASTKSKEFDAATKVIGDAAGALSKSVKDLSGDLDKVLPKNTLGNAYASAVFEISSRVSDALSKQSREAVESSIRRDMPVNLMAYGAPVTAGIQNASANALEAMRDWVIRHLEQSGQVHCDLLCKVEAAFLPSDTATALDTVRLDRTIRSGGILLCAFEEILRSCLCNALNPQCLSCDDPGVLLACLTVEDCKVKDICNLERDFVLSPTAIRYWIPEIQRIGEAIEKWCCPCPCPDDKDSISEAERTRGLLTLNPWLLGFVGYMCPRPQTERAGTTTAGFMPPASGGPAAALRAAFAAHVESLTETKTAEIHGKLADLSRTVESLQREVTNLRGKADKKRNPEVNVP